MSTNVKLKEHAPLDALNRTTYLMQAAQLVSLTTPSQTCKLARNMLESATKVSTKTNLRLSHVTKRKICKKCKSYLIPGVSATVRTKRNRQKHMVLTCQQCGFFQRYLLNKNYSLWHEKPESQVDVKDFAQSNMNIVNKPETTFRGSYSTGRRVKKLIISANELTRQKNNNDLFSGIAGVVDEDVLLPELNQKAHRSEQMDIESSDSEYMSSGEEEEEEQEVHDVNRSILQQLHVNYSQLAFSHDPPLFEYIGLDDVVVSSHHGGMMHYFRRPGPKDKWDMKLPNFAKRNVVNNTPYPTSEGQYNMYHPQQAEPSQQETQQTPQLTSQQVSQQDGHHIPQQQDGHHIPQQQDGHHIPQQQDGHHIPQQLGEQVPQQAAQQVPQQVVQQVVHRMFQPMPQQTLQQAPQETPQQIPQHVPKLEQIEPIEQHSTTAAAENPSLNDTIVIKTEPIDEEEVQEPPQRRGPRSPPLPPENGSENEPDGKPAVQVDKLTRLMAKFVSQKLPNLATETRRLNNPLQPEEIKLSPGDDTN